MVYITSMKSFNGLIEWNTFLQVDFGSAYSVCGFQKSYPLYPENYLTTSYEIGDTS